MQNGAIFRRLFLCVLLGSLLAAAGFAQAAVGDDSDKFLGKWVSDTERKESDEMSSLPRRRIELDISSNASRFAVVRSDEDRNVVERGPSKEDLLFKYANGRLERDSSTGRTWEPNEFPKRISETLKVLSNGKKLVHTTVLQGSGNNIIPGANRKPIVFTIIFTRAKN